MKARWRDEKKKKMTVVWKTSTIETKNTALLIIFYQIYAKVDKEIADWKKAKEREEWRRRRDKAMATGDDGATGKKKKEPKEEKGTVKFKTAAHLM